MLAQLAPRHALHADRQGDGDDRRQTLGNRRHRQRDADHQSLIERRGMQPDGKHHGQRRTEKHDHRQAPAKALDLAQQWRRGLGQFAQQGADPPEFGGTPDRDNGPGALPGSHHRTGIGHTLPLGQGRVDRLRLDPLAHWHRFPGQGRLIDAQTVALDQPQIGRNPIAGLQQNQITGHQNLGRQVPPVAIAANPRTRRQHPTDRLHRALGLALLDEADQGIDQHHGSDDRSIDRMPERDRRHCRSQQQMDQEIIELVQQATPGRPARRRRQGIAAEFDRSAFGFLGTEARLTADEVGNHRIRTAGMRRLDLGKHLLGHGHVRSGFIGRRLSGTGR